MTEFNLDNTDNIDDDSGIDENAESVAALLPDPVTTRSGTVIAYDDERGALIATDDNGSVRAVEMDADDGAESLTILGRVVAMLNL